MAGAAAYLLKQCDFSELTEAIRAVARGQMYISPTISDIVIEASSQGAGGERTNAYSVLTMREREVLQLVAEGNTTKQVALHLDISPKTVEAHRLKVMQKLDIDNIPQLTKYAIQEGLTTASL